MRPSISRSDERPAWLCYIALNSGVVLVALHDPLALGEHAMIRSLPVLAGVLYIVAIIAFVVHALPRIASFRVLPRPSQDGEDE